MESLQLPNDAPSADGLSPTPLPGTPPESPMSLAQSVYIRGQLHRLSQTDPLAAQTVRTELNALSRPISRAQARAFAERLLGMRETRG